MIASIARLVGDELARQGCPYRVVYGPERFTDIAAVDTRLVFMRDGNSEDIKPAISQRLNPKMYAVRDCGCTVRVIASSTLPGARREDHECIADMLVDMTIIALKRVVESKRETVTFQSGRFLDSMTLEMGGMETWPGVVYDLSIAISRGVYDRTWTGEARPEVSHVVFDNSACVRAGVE